MKPPVCLTRPRLLQAKLLLEVLRASYVLSSHTRNPVNGRELDQTWQAKLGIEVYIHVTLFVSRDENFMAVNKEQCDIQAFRGLPTLFVEQGSRKRSDLHAIRVSRYFDFR